MEKTQEQQRFENNFVKILDKMIEILQETTQNTKKVVKNVKNFIK